MIKIFENEIDKNLKTPMYKQIAAIVQRNLANGALNAGDGLPAERELAQKLNISRGTVKKAYEELFYNGIVETVQGRGTSIKPAFKNLLNDTETAQKLSNKPADMVKETVLLLSDSFTKEEIKALFLSSIAGDNAMKIAAIDCNAESLKIFRKQLNFLDGAIYIDFLINDIKEFKNPEATFNNFDILFTTVTHYEEILELLGETGKKLVKLAISPDKETVFKIASLEKTNASSVNQHGIGIISQSSRFADIIRSNLNAFGISVLPKDAITDDELNEKSFIEFIKDKKAIIMPPLYTLDLKNKIYDGIFEFLQKGGSRLTFNYSIESGSLLYMEEKARNLKLMKEAKK